jgi:hypothetical protein
MVITEQGLPGQGWRAQALAVGRDHCCPAIRTLSAPQRASRARNSLVKRSCLNSPTDKSKAISRKFESDGPENGTQSSRREES